MNIILTGSSGSGLLSAGDIVMEALQHAGYFVVADREYPSLIKGGCSYFRIEVGINPIHNISQFADIIVAFDRVGSKNALPHVRNGGLMIYGDEMHDKITNYNQTIQGKNLSTIFIPEYATPKKFGANELLSNMLMIGALWRALGLSDEGLQEAVKKKFASKPALLALDVALINHGYNLQDATVSSSSGNGVKAKRREVEPGIQVNKLSQSESDNEGDNDLDSVFQRNDGTDLLSNFTLPETTNNLAEHKLLDGNEILALSAVHHGVRAYFAYPMSPSSTVLSHLANWAEKTGMHVEQVEDEISVSQMALGASFGGTRSLCATSGGGFDLMTETVSLAGMIETPLTVIVAQRPGPATGLPTWSGQEDLNLAIFSGHGEYAKAVIAVGDHAEAFRIMGEALNLAETYQIPVILLTDKTLAETNATLDPMNLFGVEIERGITVVSSSSGEGVHCEAGTNEDPGIQLNKLSRSETIKKGLDSRIKSENDRQQLTPSSRYELTPSGISPRWLPGAGPRYYANGDEHGPDGTLREDAVGVQEAHEKRLRKIKTLESVTPEPILYGNPDARITLVGFGSTKMEVMDFVQMNNEKRIMNNGGFIKNSNSAPLSKGESKGDLIDRVENPQFRTLNSDKINYLHYTHIWPLKTETIKKLQKQGNHIVVIEHNMTAQFANLLRGAGVKVHESWLKYDGRRFYREEIAEKIQTLTSNWKLNVLFWWRKIFG